MTQRLVQLAGQLARLDLELPPRMAAVLETWKVVNSVSVDDPLAELRAKISAADLDPKTAQKLVHNAVAGFAEKKYGPEIAGELTGAFFQAEKAVFSYDALDELIADLRIPFDAAAAELKDTVPYVGAAPEAHKLQGTESILLFARWEAAVQRIDKVTAIRGLLESWGYAPDIQPEVTWFLADANTDGELERADTLYRSAGHGMSRLVAAGIELNLNTAAETRSILTTLQDRTTAAQAAAQAQRQAHEAAEGELFRDAWKNGKPLPVGMR
jgi:hypothetical protein